MELIFAPFDRCFARIGQWMTEKPRAAGITIIVSIILLLTGWLTAAHYHHVARLAPMPDDISAQSPASTSNAPAAANQIPKPTTPTSNISLQGQWHTIKIKRGDHLQHIFRRLAISQKQMHEILALGEITKPLTKIKPGQHIRLLVNKHQLQQLIYPIGKQQQLIITRTDEGFAAEMNPTVAAQTPPLPTKAPVVPTAAWQENSLQYTSLTMHRSLYASALEAGIAHAQAYQLVHLFNENQTLSKNLHRGDQVTVLYHPSNTTTANNGYIAIAQLTHKEKTFEAIRFTDPTGHTDYYNADGISLRPALERAPLHYTYISSYFSAHRWQPILHFFRPHYGVDYAAPYGTPIKAAGDGHIAFLGNKNGYGHTIYIKHADHYETVYAHMEHFAHNIRAGSFVHQGEVIGYVGNSGLSTGAHLHFEIRYDNIPRNPLTFALPSGNPLPAAYRPGFFANAHVLVAELETHHQTQLAAETTPKNNNS